MKNTVLCLVLALLTLAVIHPPAAYADIEWNVKKELKLEAAPLDAATSADGKNLYLLTAGEVLVYAMPDYRLLTRIPVEKGLDRMALSARDNRLILMSGADKTVKVLQLETVHRFSLDGLAVKGPRNAPVTLAVFSDYQ
jgi:hypothetical protein